jgi:protoporphyrin/coproporphyrin ferrochelatase
MNFQGQPQSIHNRYAANTAILITNLGTPEAPTAGALRPYLREFLSDPRVIELPKWKWWPILYGIILRVRPAKSAKLYESVWTPQGSPLMAITQEQQQQLQAKLSGLGYPVMVKMAMRYGQPAIGKVLKEIQDAGINRMIVLPLYPQYAGATTGSTFDAVAQEILKWRWLPELHFLNSYHDHPSYIQALINAIQEHVQKNGLPEKLVFSYHGMPQRYFDAGDPYYCLCQKTTRLVAEGLGLEKSQYVVSFQSQFGREAWIKPDTSTTLAELARQGIKQVAVICPGFSADCLETIEEIAVENKHVFMDAGGVDYHYIPALNASARHIQMMVDLVAPYLSSTPDDGSQAYRP